MILAADPSLLDRAKDIAPVVGAFISVSGLSALGGILLKGRIDRNQAAESWLRERRAAVYSDFLHAAHATWHHMRDAWREQDTNRWHERLRTWSESLTQSALFASQIELLGPDDVG